MCGKRSSLTDRHASRRERSEAFGEQQMHRTTKQKKTSFLLTVHGRFLFDVSKRKWGCIPGDQRSPLRSLIGKNTRPYDTGKINLSRLLPVSPFSTLFCGFPPNNLWKNILPQTSLENSLLFQQRVWKRKALQFLGFFGLSTIFFPITPFSKQYIFYSFL